MWSRQTWQMEQHAVDLHLKLEAGSRKQTGNGALLLTLQSPSPGYLQQGHTSQASANSATNWRASIQRPKTYGGGEWGGSGQGWWWWWNGGIQSWAQHITFKPLYSTCMLASYLTACVKMNQKWTHRPRRINYNCKGLWRKWRCKYWRSWIRRLFLK